MFVNLKQSNESIKSELQKFKNILYSDKSDEEIYLNGNITVKNLTIIPESEISELRLKIKELELTNISLLVCELKIIIYFN